MEKNTKSYGRRLTNHELISAISALRIWQTPSDMLKKSEELMDILDNNNLFNQPGLNFLFDAWLGATFASIKFPQSKVRLPDGQWPDIEIDGAATRQFEIVEALMPGRRRGEEYRNRNPDPNYPIREWHQAADAMPTALATAISRKVSKRYRGGDCGLIVYLNVGSTFGLRREEILNAIVASKKSAPETFTEIFILWNFEVF